MSLLRNSLLCVLLAFLSMAALKVCFLIDQAATVLEEGQRVIQQAGPQLTGAAVELRGAAREQRVYYKATGKALAIATINAARLIEHADATVQHLDAAATPVFTAAGRLITDTDASQKQLTAGAVALVADTDSQVKASGEALGLATSAAQGNFEEAEKLWPPLIKSANEMAASGDNVQQASESIRLALEPLRKPTGRLKFILHWLMGLPHFNIP